MKTLLHLSLRAIATNQMFRSHSFSLTSLIHKSFAYKTLFCHTYNSLQKRAISPANGKVKSLILGTLIRLKVIKKVGKKQFSLYEIEPMIKTVLIPCDEQGTLVAQHVAQKILFKPSVIKKSSSLSLSLSLANFNILSS